MKKIKFQNWSKYNYRITEGNDKSEIAFFNFNGQQ